MRGSIQPAEIDHQDQQAKRLLELELTPEQMDGTAPLSPGQRAKLLEDSRELLWRTRRLVCMIKVKSGTEMWPGEALLEAAEKQHQKLINWIESRRAKK